MARGNQRDKAREKNQEKLAAQVRLIDFRAFALVTDSIAEEVEQHVWFANAER